MPWSSWVSAADGTKELVSISDGHRESTESLGRRAAGSASAGA